MGERRAIGCDRVTRNPARSRVGPYLDAGAILYHVVSPLEPAPAALAGGRLRSGLQQSRARNHLGADETLRQVGMDLARGVHRTLSLAQRPRPHLVGTNGEERDE